MINYEFPRAIEDYVHRIGRTGRRDRRGTSYSFFSYADARIADDLIKVLQEARQEVNPKLLEMVQSGRNLKPGL